jgi:hypothetical protein
MCNNALIRIQPILWMYKLPVIAWNCWTVLFYHIMYIVFMLKMFMIFFSDLIKYELRKEIIDNHLFNHGFINLMKN